MLPFSDAKTRPSLYADLVGTAHNDHLRPRPHIITGRPAKAVKAGLEKTKATIEREPVKKVKLGGGSQESEEGENGGSGGGKNVIIERLLMQVDLKKIKDLQLLLKLLKEVEDYTEANGGDADAEPEPV